MRLRFLSKRVEMPGISTFCFQPLEPTEWIAGQSIRLELPAGYGVQERRFTIASAPYEDRICITTRISESTFKQALDKLQPGQEINGYGLEGKFIWEGDEKPILCASGIGITPFYAMLKQRQHDGRSTEADLIYAGRGQRLLFEKELNQLAGLGLTILHDRRLSNHAVQTSTADWQQRPIYLAGPSSMVDQLKVELLEAGLPESQLKLDWFTGQPGWELQPVEV